MRYIAASYQTTPSRPVARPAHLTSNWNPWHWKQKLRIPYIAFRIPYTVSEVTLQACIASTGIRVSSLYQEMPSSEWNWEGHGDLTLFSSETNSPIDLLTTKITKIRTRQSCAIAFVQEWRTAWRITWCAITGQLIIMVPIFYCWRRYMLAIDLISCVAIVFYCSHLWQYWLQIAALETRGSSTIFHGSKNPRLRKYRQCTKQL